MLMYLDFSSVILAGPLQMEELSCVLVPGSLVAPSFSGAL